MPGRGECVMPTRTVGDHPLRAECRPCPAGVMCSQSGTQTAFAANGKKSRLRGNLGSDHDLVAALDMPSCHYCPVGTTNFGRCHLCHATERTNLT